MLEISSAPELSASLDVSPEAAAFEVEPVGLAVEPVSSPDAEVDGGDGPQASNAATHHGDAQRVTDNGLDQRRARSRIAAVLGGCRMLMVLEHDTRHNSLVELAWRDRRSAANTRPRDHLGALSSGESARRPIGDASAGIYALQRLRVTKARPVASSIRTIASSSPPLPR